MNDIVNEGQKLHRIIENLLLLSRLEAGTALDLEPLSLEEIVTAAAESLERRAGRSVTLDVQPGLPSVLGQETLVTQVIENLLSNAGKYSPPDTTIEVRLQPNDSGQVEVSVRDHGMGLGEGEAEEVFAPFYRSKEAKHAAPGMGIGLAVCRRIVQAHAGEIRARNHPEGGAEFSFTLQAAGVVETLPEFSATAD